MEDNTYFLREMIRPHGYNRNFIIPQEEFLKAKPHLHLTNLAWDRDVLNYRDGFEADSLHARIAEIDGNYIPVGHMERFNPEKRPFMHLRNDCLRAIINWRQGLRLTNMSLLPMPTPSLDI